jgi:hypothetical protein
MRYTVLFRPTVRRASRTVPPDPGANKLSRACSCCEQVRATGESAPHSDHLQNSCVPALCSSVAFLHSPIHFFRHVTAVYNAKSRKTRCKRWVREQVSRNPGPREQVRHANWCRVAHPANSWSKLYSIRLALWAHVLAALIRYLSPVFEFALTLSCGATVSPHPRHIF